VTLRMRSRKRGHGVSRQVGHVGQDGLMRAKFDDRPKTHNKVTIISLSSKQIREVVRSRAEMRMVRWMCGVKLQDRIPSKGLERESRIRRHNLGTTVTQVAMVWVCAANRRQ